MTAMNAMQCLAITVLACLPTALAVAQERSKVEQISEIESATALAMRPSGNEERHELFVATADGRILRIASDAPDKPEVMVNGDGNTISALQFINGKTFVLATDDVPPRLRGYEISEDGKPLAAEQTKLEVRVAEGDGKATAMTLGPTALFVVGATDKAGWLLRSRIRSGVPGQMKPFAKIGTRPTCVAISTRGWVVVGDAGGADESEYSRLTFLHPSDSTAKPALEIELELLDIAAIAYSPRESMYAADTAEAESERSGIYRIDMDYQASRIGGKAVRVLSVENPKAMAFAPDGTLYAIARGGKLFRATDIE